MKVLLGLLSDKHADKLIEEGPNIEYNIAFSPDDINKKIDEQYDAILIDEDLYKEEYPFVWLPFLRRHHPDIPITIILSNRDSYYTDILKRLSIDLKVTLIPAGLGEDEYIRSIQHRLLGKSLEIEENKGQMISIMSVAPKDGATTVAINTAFSLAENTNLKVGLLDLNLKSPEIKDQLNIRGNKGFMTIQVDCEARTLTSSMLIDACDRYGRKHKNLYILSGTHRRDWADKVKDDEIITLLQVAKQTFDVVICDVHTFPDNAGTIQAIRHANERWIITQPVITSFQSSWKDWYDSVWEPFFNFKVEDFQLIINRNDPQLFVPNHIEKSIGIKRSGVLSNVPGGKGLKALNDAEPLYLSDEESVMDFKKEIDEIVLHYCQRHHFNHGFGEKKTRKLRIASFLS